MIVMVVLGDGFDGSESTTLSNDDDERADKLSTGWSGEPCYYP